MEESPVPPFNSRPRLQKNTGPSRKIKDLPESLLYSVLAQVSEIGGGFSHALVCQKWAQVSMEAKRRCLVKEGASITESDLLNELQNFPNLRKLELKRESALRLTDRFFLGIGRTCPRLESISIREDSSTMTAGFSTEGLQRMFSSLPGLKSLVLRAESSREWNFPDSLSSLHSLKALAMGCRIPSPDLITRLRLTLSSQPSVLRIPPSTRELSFFSMNSWHVAEEEGGLQGVRHLIAQATDSEVIPEALWAAGSLRSLTITAMKCPRLSTGVSRLTALRQLQLDLYRVTNLPDCFSTLQSLTELKLFLNTVESLPDSLWSLTSLKHFSLQCDELRSMDSGIGRLQRLTSLEVSSLQNSCNVPLSLCGHAALRKLHLNLGGVQRGFELRASALTDADITLDDETDLSRFLRGCPSLSSLRLNNVKDASSLLGDPGLPTSLQNIRIFGTYLRQPALPNSFGRYSNLETLQIIRCHGIIELSSSIGDCGRLTELTVDMCHHLRELPPQLGSLGNLRTLRIGECPELQCLPQSVGQLSSLEILELVDLSEFRSIPTSLGAAQRLCSLKVSDCKRLNLLPESAGQLALLTSLYVWDCPLVKELPDSMSQLVSLRVLELVGLPALQSFPNGVRKVSTLHSLTVLRCTSLWELPLELGRLKNLRNVVIVDCSTLRRLPPSTGDLLHLRKLHLVNLPSLSGIPQQIGQLSSLRDLFICNLPSLISLPGSMTLLTGLAELSIQDCHSLVWVPELLESLSEISEESKLRLTELMETRALRGIQQRRSRHARLTREGKA